LDLLIEFMCFVGLFKKEGNELRLNSVPKNGELAPPPPTPPLSKVGDIPPVAGLETYSLTLDPEKGRRVVIQAPPVVSAGELKRIQQWLSFQLLVNEESQSA